MIRSMTGFGRAEEVINGRDITVELRSVNHRFFEFSSRIPRAYGFLEEKLKSYISSAVSRGKIDVSITIISVESKDTQIEANIDIAQGYVDALRKANSVLRLEDDLTLSQLLRLPDLFTVRKAPDDEEQIWDDVKTVTEKAVAKFVEMREREGEKLREDVLERLDTIERLVTQIELVSPQTVEDYRNRLY